MKKDSFIGCDSCRNFWWLHRISQCDHAAIEGADGVWRHIIIKDMKKI